MIMNQFKRAQVIMLPTNKEPIKGNLLVRHIWKDDPKLESNTLWQYKETIVIDDLKQYTTLNGSFRDWYKAFVAVNIYIVSDDKIKEGDWTLCLDEIDSTVMNWNINQCIFKHSKGGNCTQCKKIIATTDTSLGFIIPKFTSGNKRAVDVSEKILKPQLSQQFIEKYIESYNKSEIITDVLVEYISVIPQSNGLRNNGKIIDEIGFGDINTLSVPKLNYKDNTITIKKLKDSWNRKEVVVLLNKLNNTLNIGSDLTLEEWMNKNL